MNEFLVIGQGAIGAQVSNWLAGNACSYTGMACEVTGMARQNRATYPLTAEVKFMQADVTQLTQAQTQKMADFTHIAMIVTPDEYSEQGYEQSYFAIARKLTELSLPNLQRLVFISSTGVYGQNNGELVDENTPPTLPNRISSQIILRTEQILQKNFAKKCVIIRPSGIYGIKRLMRIRKAKEANKHPMETKAWTNRIMDTDLVNIIGRVLTINSPQPLYLATDYAPVTSFELMTWLCEQLGTELPRKMPLSNKNSQSNQSNGNQSNSNQSNKAKKNIESASGKRLCSNIPKNWLAYPDWKTGYQYIISTLS